MLVLKRIAVHQHPAVIGDHAGTDCGGCVAAGDQRGGGGGPISSGNPTATGLSAEAIPPPLPQPWSRYFSTKPVRVLCRFCLANNCRTGNQACDDSWLTHELDIGDGEKSWSTPALIYDRV